MEPLCSSALRPAASFYSVSFLPRMGAFSEIISKLDYSTWPSLLRTVLLSELGALHPGDCPSQAPQDGQSP